MGNPAQPTPYKNVREKIDLAISHAVRAGEIHRDEDFLLNTPDLQLIVRDRSELIGSAKKTEFIYAKEVGCAIEIVIDYTFGIKRAEITKETLRLFGYTRVTTEMEQGVEALAQYWWNSRATNRGRQILDYYLYGLVFKLVSRISPSVILPGGCADLVGRAALFDL